jgi:PAS domain S-box-containing protein
MLGLFLFFIFKNKNNKRGGKARLISKFEGEPVVIKKFLSLGKKNLKSDLGFIHFQALAQNLPGIYYRVDTQNKSCIFVNDQIVGLCGYTSYELMMGNIRWICPEEKNVSRQNPASSNEFKIKHKNGSEKWVLNQSYTTFDSEGVPLWVDGILIDITFKKEADIEKEQNKRHLDSIISAIDDLIFEVNEQGILSINYSKNDYLFDFDLKQLIGKKIKDVVLLFPQHSAVFFKHYKKAQRTKLSTEFELEISENNNTNWFRIRFIPLNKSNPESKALMILVAHITRSKKVEKEVLEVNHYLKEFKYALNYTSIVSITDKQGIINYVNEPFVKISKYSKYELIGNKHNVINSGYHTREFWQEMWKTISAGQLWRKEVKNKAKDGSYYWVDTLIMPIKNISGQVLEYISIRNDITEKKKNEEQLSVLSMVASKTSNLVIITDSFFNTEWVNQSFTEATGYTLEDVRGKNPYHILRGGDTSKEVAEYIDAQIKKHRNFNCEILNYKKNGEKYWVQVQGEPIRDENRNTIKYFTIEHDITEQKNLIENLIKSKSKAEESERLKSAFLANMSHEIRTPMNAIMGFSEILEKPALPDNKRALFAKLIRERSIDLLSIINDILDISKLESGQMYMKLEEVNIKELMHFLYLKYYNEVQEMKSNVLFQLEYNLPDDFPSIMIDAGKINQVMNNLITNAIKFTEKGKISFGVKIVNEWLRFYVSDTGIGINREKLEQVFIPFVQCYDPNIKNYGGTGLGLSISKKIVKLFGGNICVKSKIGKGSVFSFDIPVKGLPTGELQFKYQYLENNS